MAPHLARLATIFALAFALSAPVSAGSRTSPAPPSPLYLDWLSGWASTPLSRGEQFRIGLDPETGEWGRAPVQQALEVSGVMAPPLVIHHPNGVIEVITDPANVEYLIARIGPDGRPVLGCQTGGSASVPSAPVSSGPPDR